ncbi:hypothetical protein BB934_23775 [Microvirga ossetica]|uniref:Uncharacterized protein n=1 Tax=Microvirga ossetica TaxID=1882682 RepID=A0A1B2ELL8_9HYPH|nr:hypothetical protein BB934_23775 [Microvirga ossetica]
MDDSSFARLNATNAGRPEIRAGRTEMILHPSMTGMAEDVLITPETDANAERRSSHTKMSMDTGHPT